MANFCDPVKHWVEIKEIRVPNSMDKGAKPTKFGLWGFKDFDGVELQLLATPYLHISKGAVVGTEGRVRLYEVDGYHPGRWTIDAITTKGDTWCTLSVLVSARKEEGEWSGDSSRWSQEKKLRSMDPLLRGKVQAVLSSLREQGFEPQIFFGWRSVAVQRELYKKGRTKVKFSFHNAQKRDGTPNAYAADIVDVRWGWSKSAEDNGFWKALGEAAKDEGLVWGGDWKSFPDVAHVQNRQNSELAAVKKESGL